jgi:hypothetical protein
MLKFMKHAMVALALSGLFAIAPDIIVSAPQKKTGPAKTAVQTKADAVPGARVLKEFSNAYEVPQGSKIIKATYAGKIRNYMETRGDKQVPGQSHQVSLVVQLTDCGINMRDTWEVYFYRLETEWIFRDIMQVASKQLTWPKKKHPPLDDAEAKRIVIAALVKHYEVAGAVDMTILSKKGSWRLCVPEYRVASKITVTMKNDIYNTEGRYECLIVSILARPAGTWEHKKTACVYNGKEIPDCHIGSMCRELAVNSTVPVISDDEAAKLLRASFEAEYGLRKNNVTVEKFSLVSRDRPEDFGKKITCVMRASFVIDEIKEAAGAKEGTRSTTTVRAVYDCSVHGHLRYSLSAKKWEAVIESCCMPGDPPCGSSCSVPSRGCKRLGEK